MRESRLSRTSGISAESSEVMGSACQRMTLPTRLRMPVAGEADWDSVMRGQFMVPGLWSPLKHRSFKTVCGEKRRIVKGG